MPTCIYVHRVTMSIISEGYIRVIGTAFATFHLVKLPKLTD